MLVLARNVGEIIDVSIHGVHVGEIMLVAIRTSTKARIGLQFSPEYDLHRREVTDSIESQKGAQHDGR